MKGFSNKVAVVTGAGQGIGLAICRKLAENGARIILNDREQALAEAAAESIRKDGGDCVAVTGDVSDVTFNKNLILAAVKKFGRVDIVIANAGITLYGEFLNYRAEDFDSVMAVNLRGSFFLAQAAALQFKEQQSGGRILFMSSVTGHQAHKNLTAYGMSKAALEMLAKTLVIELAGYGITVNAIAPGATITERTTKDPDYKTTWSRITPTGRPSYPADIAAAAMFLVSEEAAQITGQTVVIDGGWTSVSPSPY